MKHVACAKSKVCSASKQKVSSSDNVLFCGTFTNNVKWRPVRCEAACVYECCDSASSCALAQKLEHQKACSGDCCFLRCLRLLPKLLFILLILVLLCNAG